MSNVTIRLNDPISLDLVDMVKVSETLTDNSSRGMVLDILDRRIKHVGKTNTLGVLTIYAADVLVGFSLPGMVGEANFDTYQIDATRKWYRFGACYIKPEYRNKGYMKSAASQFKERFPNMVWLASTTNLASNAVAKHLGLVHTHNLNFVNGLLQDCHSYKTTEVENVYKTP